MKVEPFVKWVGGKRQFLGAIGERMPASFGNYYEPFVGGGALFFDLLPTKAVLNDKNSELINAYRAVKDDPVGVMDFLEDYDKEIKVGGKEYYYQIREIFNQRKKQGKIGAKQAALFIFLNKHSFNGVYRLNANGDFNIAYNNSTGNSFSEENLFLVSASLQEVELRNEDFAEVCLEAKKGDFVFLDSPYVPVKNTSFTSYTSEGFSLEDHVRVVAAFYELTRRGCYCILMNSDTELIHRMYKEFEIEVLCARRSVNSNAAERTGKEVIIKNF